LPEAMSAGEKNCRRADSINYIYNQPVFKYEGNCGETVTARRIRELARSFSNEMRQLRACHMLDFEIMAVCGTKRSAGFDFAKTNRSARVGSRLMKNMGEGSSLQAATKTERGTTTNSLVDFAENPICEKGS